MTLTRLARLALVLCAIVVAVGCSRQAPVAPAPVEVYDLTRNPLPVLIVAGSPLSSGALVPGPSPDDSLATIDECWGDCWPGRDTVIAGGRCTLRVPGTALPQAARLRCAYWLPDRLEYKMTPHGTRFNDPVELSVRYANTNADPSSPNYDGSKPKFFWYDDSKAQWVEVASVVDTTARVVHARLSHFSRYAVGGKAGW